MRVAWLVTYYMQERASFINGPFFLDTCENPEAADLHGNVGDLNDAGRCWVGASVDGLLGGLCLNLVDDSVDVATSKDLDRVDLSRD